jgi:putative peptidoglycan lipid II flippase
MFRCRPESGRPDGKSQAPPGIARSDPAAADRQQPSDAADPAAGTAPDALAAEHAHIARSAGVVGGATLLSRILGAVRDIVVASFFGTGMVADAFIAAFRIPEFLRRLFGEGSLSIAFVPVYTDHLRRHGREAADRLAASALRSLALVLALVTVAGMAAVPWLVQVLAPGFSQSTDKFALTVVLARTMWPYLWFIGMVALCMGILNVLGHFAAPALSPVCLNLAMIAALVVGGYGVATEADLAVWLAAGVVVGGALQLGLQVPFLVRHKVCFWRRAPLWHEGLGRVARLMGPVLFGAAVFQINSLVITLLASLLPQGSVAYLYYADRLVQFPLGVFGFAVATAVLPTLSHQAAAGRIEAMGQTCGHAIRLVFFITLPATVGLIVLREPIVSLLFQRGAFDAQSMRLTAGALLYYAMGLWAFSAVRIVLNAFYALQDTRTPVRIAIVSIGANGLLGWALMGPMGHQGLALALTIASAGNFFLLAAALRRRLGVLGGHVIAVSIAKSGFCAAAMGACVQLLAWQVLPAGGRGIELVPGLAACIVAGALVFALLARATGLEELRSAVQMVRGRMGNQ